MTVTRSSSRGRPRVRRARRTARPDREARARAYALTGSGAVRTVRCRAARRALGTSCAHHRRGVGPRTRGRAVVRVMRRVGRRRRHQRRRCARGRGAYRQGRRRRARGPRRRLAWHRVRRHGRGDDRELRTTRCPLQQCGDPDVGTPRRDDGADVGDHDRDESHRHLSPRAGPRSPTCCGAVVDRSSTLLRRSASRGRKGMPLTARPKRD